MNNREESINLAKGWNLVNFCEFDKYAVKSYCAIHNESEKKNLGDITKVDETKLEPFNMICGGSPCQDFSVAGKHKGSVWTCKDCGSEYNPLTVHWSKRDCCPHCGSKNLDKSRSSLLVEWLRVIRGNKPNFGIYENVKNIVGKQFKETFRMFTEELEEYGYNVYWKVLNAKNYGVPQNRERVYLIIIKKELDNGRFKYPEPFDNGIRLKDILEDKVDKKYYIENDRVQILIQKAKDSQYVNKSANFELKDGTSSYAIRSQEFVRTGFTTECSTLAARDYKDPHCVVVAIMNHSQDGKIYDENGISPTHTAGHNNQPKVYIKQATKKGYIECEVGGVADLSYPDSKTRRGRVQDGGNISPTITATETGVCRIENNFRVRKLTPKECFRLMGFSDVNFNAARNVGVSDTQLYKQAGNSIVVNVLHSILIELYIAMPYLFDNLRLSSYFSGIGAFEIALNRLFEDINNGNFMKSQMV